mgnify:CR=1 FL=1
MSRSIEDFLEYLEYQKKYSENTVEAYRNDLEGFEQYVHAKKIDYKKMNYSDVTDYLIHLSNSNMKPASVNRHLSSLRSFYSFLLINKEVKDSPFELVNGPKKEKRLPNYLQYDEFLDLIKTCDEILGKGKKTRIVYFNKTCQEVMSKYVCNARQELLKGKHCEYLFVNHLGNALTRRGVSDILEKLIMKSSIKHKISPHTLRHTFATLMLNEGMDIREVQELLGHARLSTTSIYTHVSNEELRRIYLQSHPRAHRKP